MRLLVLLILLPLASAQTLVELETWVAPEEYFLAATVHPDEIPPAVLHVKGEIQCQPGMEPPAHLALNYAGSSVVGTVNGEQLTYTKVDLGDFNVTWTPQGGDLYVIDETYEVPIIREAIPDKDLATEHAWDAVFGTGKGSLACDPQGYGWNVDAKNFQLTVEGFGHIADDGFEFPDKETPAPFGLALLALLALAVKKRE